RGNGLDALANQSVTFDAAATDAGATGHVADDGRRRLVRAGWILFLLAVLAFLVIYPVLMLVISALTDSNPVVDGLAKLKPSVDNFTAMLSNPNVLEALVNSLIACGSNTALALTIGLAFSWIVVHTNTPCKSFIAAVSMIPL